MGEELKAAKMQHLDAGCCFNLMGEEEDEEREGKKKQKARLDTRPNQNLNPARLCHEKIKEHVQMKILTGSISRGEEEAPLTLSQWNAGMNPGCCLCDIA